jgi:putative acetyltransferase
MDVFDAREGSSPHGSALSVRRLASRDEGVAEFVTALDRYQVDLYGLAGCHLEPIDALERSGTRVFGAFDGRIVVGIGGIRMRADYAEIKRMYVEPASRGSGAAAALSGAIRRRGCGTPAYCK